MQTNGQLEHTSNAHWVEAIAKALGAIKDLAEKQDKIIDRQTRIMLEEQQRLAQMITENIADHENYPADGRNADRIEQYHRMMIEDRRAIEAHKALRDGYLVATAILEAATGEYHYAAYDGYYRTDLKKFQTAEARDAFLEKNGEKGWREANEDDLNNIFWANILPTEATPEA